MARTQIKASNILDHTLTGASFSPEMAIYDETKNYSTGVQVWWQGYMWKSNTLITGMDEGDLSQSPDISSDWNVVRGIAFAVYPTTAQTFTNTGVIVKYDGIRYDNAAFTLNAGNGEITVNEGGIYIVSVTQTNENNSNSRDTSWTYIQIDKNDGQGFVDVPNFKISGYHRNNNDGETTGNSGLPLLLNQNDKLRIFTASRTGTALDTVPDACNLILWAPNGTRGPKGDTGDDGVLTANFYELLDTPSNYSGAAGQMVVINAAGDALEFTDAPDPTIDLFIDLTDTPADYIGQENKMVNVASDASGLEFSLDKELVPEYKLIATASTPLNMFEQVSMDVNGDIQGYPATGGEGYSTFSTRNIQLHFMIYLSNNTGIMIYTDGTQNTLFMKPGVAQTDGSILWGTEDTTTTTGNVINIKGINIDGTVANVTWVTDSATATETLRSVNVQTDGTNITKGTVVRPGDSGSHGIVTTADVIWDYTNDNLVWSYAESSSNVFNNYASTSGLSINLSGQSDTNMSITGNIIDMEAATEGDNIIIQILKDTGDVQWTEAAYKRSGFRYHYDDLSNIINVASGVLSLGGFEASNGAMFGQVELSSNTWQTYYSRYTSGGTIDTPSPFGGNLTAQEAQLVNTNSGAGYNILYDGNTSTFKVYEGNANNPSAGYSFVYGGATVVTTSNPMDTYATMFGSQFAIVLTGDTSIRNNIYFIDSNATRSDNYIGNAAHSANPGDPVEIFIGLPMINHSMTYNRGDIFYLGPYKYQAIDEHKVLMIIEETVFP